MIERKDVSIEDTIDERQMRRTGDLVDSHSVYSNLFHFVCSKESDNNDNMEWLWRSKPDAYKFVKKWRKFLPDATFKGVVKFSGDIEHLKTLIEKSDIDKGREGAYNTALTYNMPKLIDENVVRILVHENKAHASMNHKKGYIKLLSVRTSSAMREYASGELDEIARKMKQSGYSVKIDHNPQSIQLSINVEHLCDMYECKSIQRRYSTGRQIRANFYTVDKSGLLEKSKLETLGILVIPHDMEVEIIKSHDRKIRTDAIYTEKHPDEIVFGDIPEGYITDRFYKNI